MIDYENYPTIAAVKNKVDFAAALDSDVQTLFLLSSNILTVEEYVERAHAVGKLLFVHMDFVDGLSKDASGVKYLATKNIDGIISTRSNIIAAAAECKKATIQRFFMIDSRSVDTALETIRNSKTDMVEIMPGIAYKAIEKIARNISIPLIAGGLIEHKDEIFQALNCGATMISTGKQELWNM